MSWITATRGGSSPIGILAGLTGAAGAGIVEALKHQSRCRAGMRAMAQLDDHLLCDIGLTRADIRAAALGRPALNVTALARKAADAARE